jgi:hypothetical protein
MIELAPRTPELMDYDLAWLYCITLGHNDCYDWRIPTADEYKSSRCSLSWHETRYMFLDPLYHVTPVRDKDA